MVEIGIGIDVGELGGKGLDLVALDSARRVVRTLRAASLDAVTKVVLTELRPRAVCIDSPPRWAPRGGRRACERALTRVGINLFTTPAEERASAFHRWMRSGFSVFEAVCGVYPQYCGGAVAGTAAEYFPHASAVALAGFIAPRREKLRFRRDVLAAHGVDVAALSGIDQIDAALGALTALLALEGRHCWTGGADGAILLPIPMLPARFPRTPPLAR